MELTWVEISQKALAHNMASLRKQVGKGVFLAPAVKANAYGHGLVEVARTLEKNGADFLCVNAVFEARALRRAGVKCPLLIIGYTPLSELEKALSLNCELVVYNTQTLEVLAKSKKKANLHLKIETGNHRQGIHLKDIKGITALLKKHKNLHLNGASTHFADIEDRVNHAYALKQIEVFKKALEILKKEGFEPRYKHCANSAATLVLPEAHFNFVRPGIAVYGLWPSEKTRKESLKTAPGLRLMPVLQWKTLVAQVKEVDKGALIGYGSTYKMPHKGRIAVLPVGYYDGYVRLLSNKGQVLIKGKKAPVIGRVCMNMIMVDVTGISGVKPENEAMLIGKQGRLEVTAENLAAWSQTINYEVTTRINERIPRKLLK